MKLYNKIVEKLSMHMDKMVIHSVFTFNLMITLYKLSLNLLKWGRIANLVSFTYTLIAIGFTILSASSKRASFDILTHEQSYIILISALLLWTIVLILRFTSLLIKDATEMWEKKMEKKLNSK